MGPPHVSLAPNHKESAIEFLRLAASGKVREAYRKFVGPEFRGAVVHVFRFQGNLIAELWDVGQAVPENSPNEYGMF